MISVLQALIKLLEEIGRPIPARNEPLEGPPSEAQRFSAWRPTTQETYPGETHKDSKPLQLQGFFFCENREAGKGVSNSDTSCTEAGDFSLFSIMKPRLREKFQGLVLSQEDGAAYFYRNYSHNLIYREKNIVH